MNVSHEFHEACHSVTFIVLVNSHQRWKQTRNRVCFHLWCELTLALWCHSIIWSLFFMKYNVTEWWFSWNSWWANKPTLILDANLHYFFDPSQKWRMLTWYNSPMTSHLLHTHSIILWFLFCLSAIDCGKLDPIENATLQTNDTIYGIDIVYKCNDGYQFPDKDREKTVKCEAGENDTMGYYEWFKFKTEDPKKKANHCEG